MIDGIVLTFQDIVRPKRETDTSREFFEAIVQTLRDPLLVLDDELCVHFANEAFCHRFQLNRKTIEQRPVFELWRKPWADPPLRERLQRVFKQGDSFHDEVVEGDFADAGRKRLRLNARLLEHGPREPKMVLLVLEEVNGK